MSSGRARLYHNLSVMLDAGVPILKALRTAGASAPWAIRRATEALSESLLSGDHLAEAMARRPGMFARLDVTMVEAGESSGRLDRSISMLAKWYEFRDRIRRTVISGLVFPAVILHAAAFLAPLPAVFLKGIGLEEYAMEVAQTLGLFYVPAAIVLVIARIMPSRGLIRWAADGVLLCVPVLGGGLRQLAISRYCSAFAILHESGQPLQRSATIAADACGNAVIRRRLQGAVRSVEAGRPMSEGFARRMPPDFVAVWQVGELTGSLEEVANRQARLAADAAEATLDALAIWLPRIVYVLICVKIVSMILTLAPQVFGGLM